MSDSEKGRQPGGDDLVHGTGQAVDCPPKLLIRALGRLDLPEGLDGGDPGLVAVTNGVAEVEQILKGVEVGCRRCRGCLEVIDQAEPETPEVAAERGPAGVLVVELAALGEKRTQEVLLTRHRSRDVNIDGLVVQAPTVPLELRHEDDKEAPVQLRRAPPSASRRPGCLGVDGLQLGEAGEAYRLPVDEGV
ncbi:MAG: hypothetical protein ACRDZW_07565 [Acidimicrobiales bacterium]